MTAEILSTGDELRTGALIDSNGAWIAERLEAEGFEVLRHTTVGDDFGQLVQVLKEIGGRSDFAVVTGGLGPTTDDLTREAVAEAAGVELFRSEEAFTSLEGFFRDRNRTMRPSNLKQALLPETAVCIPNSRGSAPGFHLRIDRCLFFFLPGVPSEMKPMLDESVLPEIRRSAGTGNRFSIIRTFRSFGLTESSAGEKLEGFDHDFPDLKLGYRGCFPEIQIKIYASGADETVLRREVESASAWIRERIGHKVFSENGDNIEKVVADLLRRQGATISVVEHGTGGLLSHTLTEVPGSGDFFHFSAVSSSITVLREILSMTGSASDRISEDAAEATAREMAAVVREHSGATYGISAIDLTNSVPAAETESGSAGSKEAVLCVGLAGPEGAHARMYRFSLFRPTVKKALFSMAILNLLRKELIGKS